MTDILTALTNQVFGPTASTPITGAISASQSRSRNIPAGAESTMTSTPTNATFQNPQGIDWRVKLSLPAGYENSELIKPLAAVGGFIFPYTPTVEMQSTASYTTTDIVHANYPFLAYNNSRVEQLNIRGDFYCENTNDALYWIASVHYLKSITKMYYGQGSVNGQSSSIGNPPPIVKLNGYGSYVFNNIPVAVLSYNVELPKDVDYISINLNTKSATSQQSQASTRQTTADGIPIYSMAEAYHPTPVSTPPTNSNNGLSWVPIKSSITVTVQPVYSRNQTQQFNLSDFINGKYVINGAGYL